MLAFSYVRFSSEKQELGDSLRRQLKLAEDYALQHNLTLDTKSYRDLGISAFKGKNIRDGALGAFLSAVDSGLIPKGSTLLVENIDRLSRAVVDEALELFMGIIRRGITIVTLHDNQVYSTERIKQDKGISLIISITYMMRAHEESATKSKRVKEAWDAKRQSKTPVKNCPSWLQVNAAGTAYVKVAAKVKIVQKIFELAAKGNGIYLIYRHLNENKIPQLGLGRNGWQLPEVSRILHNQATIGRLVSIKHGTVIEDYYPPIIDKDLFFSVQEKITTRFREGKGRKGKNVANLFSGLIQCGDCGDSMRFTRTPTAGSKKINVYLQCMGALLKKGCESKRINYENLERELLDDLLNIVGIEFHDETESIDPAVTIRAEIAEKEAQIERLMDLMEQEGSRESKNLLGRLKTREQELAELNAQLNNSFVPRPSKDALDEAKALLEEHNRLVKTPGDELTELRLRMQGVIKHFVESIRLPSAIHDGYEEGPKQYRIAYVVFREKWNSHFLMRDYGALYKDKPEHFAADLKRFSGSENHPWETWYEVPKSGFQPGNTGFRKPGRPRKKATPDV